ncbi:biopolymer transporter ExbD [Fulvitalea axinellae]|uniref:Biopolymer transporter ExbD n=1 Tax=Fulvitalea axinellae TaxID=1182444 RepID=A0AAU9CR80_9BACT|nr:biopolymer transporter ExbD [Fulvitalea axinellae]
MSKFKKKTSASQEIPTSALPDIIFMLLFFFMVTTVMRTDDILVNQRLPQATELSKIEKKSLVSYIYIGSPKDQDKYGSEPKIQLNDVLMEPEAIVQYVNTEKDKLPEVDRNRITMSMKVDSDAKMGIISDVQEELKKASALKVLYASTKKVSL